VRVVSILGWRKQGKGGGGTLLVSETLLADYFSSCGPASLSLITLKVCRKIQASDPGKGKGRGRV